ncbi:MAG TPA: carboxypeptidase-like regulatory domain-containing protein, partial [Pyrinomonadaceae bacterium]|nr:carboxypeptidase-like regulatory domain-containing protein [Pyrinomonadaceae bacterium]
MNTSLAMRRLALSACLLLTFVATAFTQSPNTASITVTVVDQNDALVTGATISVVNSATGSTRDAVSGDGPITIAGLSITGEYSIKVAKSGFTANDVAGLTLRAGETSSVKVKLTVSGGTNQVTVFGTAQGVRADAQIGRILETKQIDETPILGRKFSSLPLLNSAFRQGKGTGDLFVNQTYFITGVGSRRATTFTLDGADNNEGWGRQTAIATVPIGAVQEVNVMTNAFSAEFGWTSGPALNIVTKSGGNTLHGEVLGLFRPGGKWQARSFSTKNYCPESVASTCVVPATLQAINPVDIPDTLGQGSFSIGGPIKHDRTFFFFTVDHTRQNRTTFLSSTLPSFVLPADGHLDYTGHYRQTLVNARIDHKIAANQDLMVRFNVDRMTDDNPQDAVGGTSAPSVARRYSRAAWTTQVNHTWTISPSLLNEARFSYLHGDPVTLWEAQNLTTTYTRAGSVPFTIGQSRSSDIWGHQFQFADTLSWTKGQH